MPVTASSTVPPNNAPHFRSRAMIEKGQLSCRSAVKRYYRDALWVGSNLPGDERMGCLCIAHHLMRVLDMLHLESFDGSSLDVWQEVFDEVNEALNGNPATNELAALADTVKQFKVPHELILEPLRAADTWICQRRHVNFEELAECARRIGGSLLTAAAIVAGVKGTDFEDKAHQAGKAIMLTQLLAHSITDIRQGRIFLAEEDLKTCEVEVHRLKMRQSGKPLTWLVRLNASRIEKLFPEGGELLNDLDFGARRSFTSLLTMHWQMLRRMQLDPETILSSGPVLSRKDLFKLKTRHVLGLEGNAPIFPESKH